MAKDKIRPLKQQGKAYTPAQRAEILESLNTYFILGYSRQQACINAGFDLTTLLSWEKKDPSLSSKINATINKINAKARQNIAKSIDSGNLSTSQWWAERREKNDFSSRTENVTDTLDEFRKEARREEKESVKQITEAIQGKLKLKK